MFGFGFVVFFELRNFVWKLLKLVLVILSGCEDIFFVIVKFKYVKYVLIILEVWNKYK